mmetsp:Transcript_68263/g.215947  ORF Transcript_68263/g.215947 Transcript_68263/m.215947 type:complete len:336 (+) Transcript_68263:1066-2073(+)
MGPPPSRWAAGTRRWAGRRCQARVLTPRPGPPRRPRTLSVGGRRTSGRGTRARGLGPIRWRARLPTALRTASSGGVRSREARRRARARGRMCLRALTMPLALAWACARPPTGQGRTRPGRGPTPRPRAREAEDSLSGTAPWMAQRGSGPPGPRTTTRRWEGLPTGGLSGGGLPPPPGSRALALGPARTISPRPRRRRRTAWGASGRPATGRRRTCRRGRGSMPWPRAIWGAPSTAWVGGTHRPHTGWTALVPGHTRSRAGSRPWGKTPRQATRSRAGAPPPGRARGRPGRGSTCGRWTLASRTPWLGGTMMREGSPRRGRGLTSTRCGKAIPNRY